jgi:sec-independent protein translocase protein TatB
MLDFSWGELLVIGVVALIVIGPKELPSVLRTVGQWVAKIRRMAGEFQSQFQEAMREAEMADLKKHVDELSDTARGLTRYDPLKELETMSGVSATDVSSPPSSPPPSSPPSPSPAPPSPEVTSSAAGPSVPDVSVSSPQAAAPAAPATEQNFASTELPPASPEQKGRA